MTRRLRPGLTLAPLRDADRNGSARAHHDQLREARGSRRGPRVATAEDTDVGQARPGAAAASERTTTSGRHDVGPPSPLTSTIAHAAGLRRPRVPVLGVDSTRGRLVIRQRLGHGRRSLAAELDHRVDPRRADALGRRGGERALRRPESVGPARARHGTGDVRTRVRRTGDGADGRPTFERRLVRLERARRDARRITALRHRCRPPRRIEDARRRWGADSASSATARSVSVAADRHRRGRADPAARARTPRPGERPRRRVTVSPSSCRAASQRATARRRRERVAVRSPSSARTGSRRRARARRIGAVSTSLRLSPRTAAIKRSAADP